MTDESEPDSGLRRRAALLLLMLAVVAVLFVVVLSALLDSSDDGGNSGAAPDDTLIVTPSSSSSQQSASTTTHASTPRSSTSQRSSTASGPATKTCPTQQTCVLQGDFGKAINAINDYRAQHGKDRVPGTVSKSAQKCAENNGSGCSGGWAETQLPTIDGQAAVKKIAGLGKLLDPDMKSFGVGWAYSPGAKQYYFAIIRKS